MNTAPNDDSRSDLCIDGVYLNSNRGNVLVGNNSGNTTRVAINTNSTTEVLTVGGNICATGSIGACSDARFKTNVSPLRDALSLVKRLNPVRFDWRVDEFKERHFSNDPQIGFIAQDVMDVVPEVVSQGADGYYSVDYGRLTPLLVEAVKSQQSQIEDLHRQVDDYKEQLANTNARLARLEEMLADRMNQKDPSR